MTIARKSKRPKLIPVKVTRTPEQKLERELRSQIALLKRLLREERARNRELLTRIQGWEPGEPWTARQPQRPITDAPPVTSQPDDLHEDEPVGFSVEELAAMGLQPNSAGGVLDTKTGTLYESVEAAKEFRAWLSKKGLPADTKPDDVRVDFQNGG